jgi:hypothetical protein
MEEEPEAEIDVEILMEAALRLGIPEQADDLGQSLFLAGELLSVRAQVLRGIAKLMLGQRDLARTYFGQAQLRRERGSRLGSGLEADQWALLTLLVPDSEQTAGLEQFFDTGT